MARGLSELQKFILAVAYRNYKDNQGGLWRDQCTYAGEILDLFYPDKTPAQRVAVTKSLKRLLDRQYLEGWKGGREVTGKRTYYKLTETALGIIEHPRNEGLLPDIV